MSDYGDYSGEEDNYDYEAEEETITSQQDKMFEESKTDNKQQVLKDGVTFLTIETIKDQILKKSQELSELTALTPDESLLLLRHFKWRFDLAQSEWFGNEDKLAKEAGFKPNEVQDDIPGDELTCNICFDTDSRDKFEFMKCNHYICRDCFKEYVDFYVDSPQNDFFWSCPYKGCNMVVPHSSNIKAIEKDGQEKINKYYKKMGTIYSHQNKQLKWCPAPDCVYVCQADDFVAQTIECPCGWAYCFKCNSEDHQPCDCKMVEEWLAKVDEGGPTQTWLKSNTKPCPKCKNPIQKTYGCNHMTCGNPACGHHFCWLCLEDLNKHTGMFFCNKLKVQQAKFKTVSEKELQKYTFYFERYQNAEKALKEIPQIKKTVEFEAPEKTAELGIRRDGLDFLQDACNVLFKSKRILKWSYCYGYSIDDEVQRNMYEIIQEKLDIYSSELHVLLMDKYEKGTSSENELKGYKDSIQLCKFKNTQAAENFIDKMKEFEQKSLQDPNSKKAVEKSKKSFGSKLKGFFGIK